MFKVVALFALVGVASAGKLGLAHPVVAAVPAVAIAATKGHAADVAALSRNAHIQAAGDVAGAARDVSAIGGAIATSAAGAANAAAIDQANQNTAVNILAAINADSAARNAANSATLANYNAARNAAIQSQQVAIARAAASSIIVPVAPVAAVNYGAALGVGSPYINAAYGVPAIGAYGAFAPAVAYSKGAKFIV